MTITVKVPGNPRPQGSKSYLMIGGRPQGIEACKGLPAWRNDVRAAAMLAMGSMAPLSGPLSVTITFVLPRPKKHFRTGKHSDELRIDAPKVCGSGDDVDKLSRAILDSLTSVVFVDDRQVATLLAMKIYGMVPGAEINITEAQQ
jgi:Holliday junction resolvase RusA-like endonuclease